MITYRYDAYGNTTKSNNTLNNPYQYNAEYTDSSTGLQYLRARYYDSSQGRFTAKDTLLGSIEKPITLNLYTYCGNNPLNLIDLSGHGWWKDRWEDIKTGAKKFGSWVYKTIERNAAFYSDPNSPQINPNLSAVANGEPLILPPGGKPDPFKPISDKIVNNAVGLHLNKKIKKTYDEVIADLDEKINNATSEKVKAVLRKQKEALEQERKELCKEMNKQRVNIATGVFDYIGYVPYIGAPADTINAVLYATQKDWLSSGICAVSAASDFLTIAAAFKMADNIANDAAQELIKELKRQNIKFNEDDILFILKNPNAKTFWLESGNEKAGLMHIIANHADDFANRGIKDISGTLQQILRTQPIKTGSTSAGLYAEYLFKGAKYRVAYGTNGFIVSFYPI